MVSDLTPLPMSLQALLNPAQVESQRLEFKATWDDKIRDAVVETACAFANDLYNQNGGYIVLGVEQSADGQLVLPPRGVDKLDLDRLKKSIFAACKAITPDYQPMLFVETYQGRRLIILFCPGGDNRPYQAPNHRRPGQQAYFTRHDSITAPASGDTLRQLMEQASKIPWDDRRCLGESTLAISPTLVRRHLHLIGSQLDEAELPAEELYRKLRLVVPINAHSEPRNVALLFFHDEPTRFFPGARIELCEFPEGRGGDRLVEHTFRGPLPDQLRACQTHLDGVLGSITQKLNTGIEARRIHPYPGRALQEVLVNAVYHRGYESSEPTKVYLEPDCITITSYPGPHPRIHAEHFRPGNKVPEVPARNRRIGELLKELKLAEARGSGILKIQAALAQNGSPPAEVDCDATFFSVRVPIHADFAILNAVGLIETGNRYAALETIKRAFARQPTSSRLASCGVQVALMEKNEQTAREILNSYILAAKNEISAEPVLLFASYLVIGVSDIYVEAHLEARPIARAHDELSSVLLKIKNFEDDLFKIVAAYCFWSIGELGEALILLDGIVMKGINIDDVLPSAVMLAGIKLELAAQNSREISEQLLGEAEDQLSNLTRDYENVPKAEWLFQAHCRIYLRLAQVRERLGMPTREINSALHQARQLAEQYRDREALTYLDRHFPTGGRRRNPV